MMRVSICSVASSIVLIGSAVMAEPVTVTILNFSDADDIGPARGKGGFAELMTLIEAERAANPNTVLTFSGDLISPSLMSGITKGEQMIEAANAIGVEVAVVGNHEYDFGPEIAVERYAASEFPWLGSNILSTEGGLAEGLQESLMIDQAGYKIGLIGITTPDTAALSSPGEAINFVDPMETATRLIAELKEQGADIVVALTHQELPVDQAMLEQIDGLDIILGGHEHYPLTIHQDDKLLLKSGYDAHYLAAVDLSLNRVDDDGELVVEMVPQWRFVSTAGVEPHAEVQAITDKWNAQLDEDLNIEIGATTVDLDTQRSTVRGKESNFGNLIADAIRDAMGADVGLMNGGGIRGDRVYESGTVLTRRDVFSELPFGNVTVLIELTGEDLLAALENGVSQVEEVAGRFPQVSGLTYTYDMAQPSGERIVEVLVGGEPLDPAATYSVATNDYVFGGGDGYTTLSNGKLLIDPAAATLMATTVMNYITALGGDVSPAVEGRITRVN